MLRHEFGLAGTTLTAGALAGDATVTSPEAIGSYIDQRVSTFDLDGNGSLDALTDGLLLLRYLFGLSGDAMTNGVIGSGATRDNYAEISAHIDGSGDPGGSDDSLRFVYQTKCTTDYQGNEVCFSKDDAGFQDVVVGNGSGGRPGLHRRPLPQEYLMTTVRSKCKPLLISGLTERFLKIPMVTEVLLLKTMMAICKTV